MRVGPDRIDFSEVRSGGMVYMSTIPTLLVLIHSKPSDGAQKEPQIIQPWEPISGKVL